MDKKYIYFANDHAGYEYKDQIINHLKNKGYEVVDLGANQEDGSVNYPDYAFAVSKKVVENETNQNQPVGVLVCGTGIGMSMAASKVANSRVALVYDDISATLAKEHNNANVISLGARTKSLDQILSMLDHFLEAKFAGDRHQKRIDLISEYEQKHKK